MNNETIAHEAAHIAAALYCGVAVMSASINKASDGNIEGVGIAAAGSVPQVHYSWCIFYRFPYFWETAKLGIDEKSAQRSCSEDLANFEKFLAILSNNTDYARKDIDAECERMLSKPLVLAAIEEFSKAFERKRVLGQQDIYAIWQPLAESFASAPPAGRNISTT